MDESLKSRIRENLVSRRAEQFKFLSDLVKTPSELPPGDLSAISDLTAKALKGLGLGVERHAVPDDLSAEQGSAGITNLVVRHEFASGPVVALSAHGDTGPRGEGWTVDPLGAEIKKGVLSGLGVITKADLALYAYALAALKDAHPDLSGTVELHFTFDGHADGRLGPGWLLKNGVVNPDYAVGSGFTYGIATSAMGDLQLQVEIGCEAPAPGTVGPGPDTLEAASQVMGALYQLREKYADIKSEVPGIGSPAMVIGQIEGGNRPDQSPERVVFTLDRRLLPEDDPAAVETELTALIAGRASRLKGIVCNIRRLSLSAPMKSGPGTDKLSGCLERQAAAVLGGPVWVYGVPYDANSRHYAALGIPTVLYGAGPATREEARLGGPDERLILDDLRKATEVVALALAEFLTPAA